MKALSEIFLIHGIPNVVGSDNSPQYASREFKDFSKAWGFTHMTSSPLRAQANGKAERAVQTAKNILRKNTNPYLGLLAYRTGPLHNGKTPSEILMIRKLRTTVPTTRNNLQSKQVDFNALKEKEDAYKERYEENYNNRHKVATLPALQMGDRVLIRDQNRYGEVMERLNNSLRSYKLLTDGGTVIRRNRDSLICTGIADQGDNLDHPAEHTPPESHEPAAATTRATPKKPTGVMPSTRRASQPAA